MWRASSATDIEISSRVILILLIKEPGIEPVDTARLCGVAVDGTGKLDGV